MSQTLDDLYGKPKDASKPGTSLDELYGSGKNPLNMTDFRKKQKLTGDIAKRGIDLLTRYGQARSHLAAEHPTMDALGSILPGTQLIPDLNTMIHGESPEQYEKDTQTLEQRHGIPGGWLGDMATQIAYDPTTAIGGSGAARHLFEAGAEHALPAAMKAWAKAGAPEEGAHSLLSALHDFVTPGGHNAAHAARVEALQHGAQGVRNYQALYGMRGATEHAGAEMTHAITTGFRRAIKGLTPDDRLKVYRAIDAGDIDKLPANLKTAAQDVQRYDRAIPWLGGSAALRKQMEQHGYALPEDLQRFDSGPRGVINADNFRENHIPGTHELDPEDALKLSRKIELGLRPGKSLTETSNPQFRSRLDLPVIDMDPTSIEDAFEASFRRAGRQLAAADLRKTLAQRFAPAKEVTRRLHADDATIDKAIEAYNKANPLTKLTRQQFDKLQPSVQDIVVRPAQASKTIGLRQRFADVPQHIVDFFERSAEKLPEDPMARAAVVGAKSVAAPFKYASDVSRSAMFTTPFQHPMRIASLLAGHAPEQIPSALAKYLRTGLGFAGDATRDKVLGKAAKAGATGVPNIEESKLQSALQKIPLAGKPASKWFGAVQKMVWGFDDAAKSALFDKYLKLYGDPYRAAYHVQHDMVDYGASSPLTESARTVSSFPTWRTRMPVAVLRAALKNPQNLATIARVAPALLGAQFGENPPKKLTSSALGEGVGAFNDPLNYLRGSASPSTKLLGDLAEFLSSGGRSKSNWMTYGQSPTSFALHESPFVGQAMSLSGNGLFPGSPEENLLFQLLGIESNEPKPPKKRSHKRRYGGSSE